MSNYRLLVVLFVLPGALWALGSFTLQKVDRLQVNTESKISVLSPTDIQERFTVTTTSEASIPCPVMTATQRDALTPVDGDCVFNDDDKELNIYDGTAWVAAGGSGGGLNQWATSTDYVAGDVVWLSDDNKIYRALSDFTSGGSFTRSNWAELSPSHSDLLNRLSTPSFEDSIASVTCSGCTASQEGTETFDGSFSYEAAFSAATGTLTATVADTRLSGVQIEASCYVKTSASGVVFKAQKNGSDVAGLSIDVPNDDTWRLIGIPFVGGPTSSGFQIEATGSITDSIFIDQCSVGTDFRVNDFSQVTGAQELVFAKNNGATAITADTTPLDWTEIRDPYGMWDGSTFTPSENAIYSITFGVSFTTASARTLDLWANPGSGYAQYVVLGVNYSNSDGTGTFVGKLDAGTTYQIRSRSGGTLANSTVTHYLSISRVKSANTITLGPDNFTGQTKWKSYTGSSFGGLGTPAVQNLKWKRDGNEMLIKGYLEVGTTSGALGFIPLPSGYQIDTAELTRNVNTSNLSEVVGGWYRGIINTGPFHGTILPATLTSTTVLYLSDHWNTSSNRLVPSSAINGSISSGDAIAINIRVPILGWDQGSAIAEVIRPKVCVLTDQKGSGTAGGASSAATWNPRILNSTTGDCDFVTLSNGTTGTDGTANRFTVLRGTYQIACSAPAFAVQLHQLRIVEDPAGSATTVFNGNGAYARSASDASSNMSEAEGTATFTASTVLQLQHYTQSASAVGLGLAVSSGATQYFGRCTITKLQ